MSNLIRYIIQEDPEKEMRKKTWEKPTYSSIVAPQEEIEASKKRSQNLLESALSSYNTKHTPTPWAKKQSNNLLERMSMTTPSAPKRLENNTPNLNRSAAGDIALEGLKGFGQGIISGAESLLNGITLGGYSKVDEKYVTVMSEDYPEVLKGTNCPPIVMFYEGNMDLLKEEVYQLMSPFDITKRLFFKMESTNDGMDYFIGCENSQDLVKLVDFFIDQHPEMNFKNYRDGDALCI